MDEKFEYQDDYDCVITATITPEIRNLIVNTILELYKKIGFCGESIIQSDGVYIIAPSVVAELADKIGFEIEYFEDM